MNTNNFHFSMDQIKLISNHEFENYECKHISKPAARRMNQLTKVATDYAMEITRNKKIDYIVHGTRYGEIENFCNINEDLLKGTIPSPTVFSQSTQNSLVGNLSIINNLNVPTTSISAGYQSFAHALQISVLTLHAKKITSLLFVYSEPKPHKVYQKHTDCDNSPFIFACILEKGEDLTISNTNDKQNAISFEIGHFNEWLDSKDEQEFNFNNFKIKKTN